MSTSLYDLSVATYLQTLSGISVVLEKGFTFCTDNNIDTNVVVETRLYPNMLPFRFQVNQIHVHSVRAIDALKSGTFKPHAGDKLDYTGLQALVKDSAASLQALVPNDINALAHNEVNFIKTDLTIPFTAPNFIMSFSLPNFYFHATTAYDILRSIGVPLSKRHYLGAVRYTAPTT